MTQTPGQIIPRGTVAPLRYTICRHLAELEYNRKNRVKNAVMDECKVSASSLSRYINERITDVANMPATVLQSFSRHLGVSMEALLNK